MSPSAGEYRKVGTALGGLPLSDIDRRVCHRGLYGLSVRWRSDGVHFQSCGLVEAGPILGQDVRDGHNRWADNAIERLKELGLENATIGISGLSGLFRAPDGIIPHTTVTSIQSAFPHARLVNVTEMMQEVRAVKSPEEVSFLERPAAIIDEIIQTMATSAKPGLTEKTCTPP